MKSTSTTGNEALPQAVTEKNQTNPPKKDASLGDATVVSKTIKVPKSVSKTATLPPDPRPKIELSGPGRLTSAVATELGQLLAPHGIYSHNGCAAAFDNNTGSLLPTKPARFATWLEQYALPFKNTKDGEEIKTMSRGEAGAILASSQFLGHLREVVRINHVAQPVTRADGNIELLPVGYDRDSQILTVPSQVKYRTDMTLEEAKTILDNLLAEFPFADTGRSKAIAIAAMLTTYAVNIMPSGTILPVFLYKGNVPGLGKGLLVQAAVLPVLGYTPTGVKPSDETEMRKYLFSVAREGWPVIFLDNITGKLASSSLESFITTSTVSGRVLGSSTTLHCRKNTVVFVTGNNCVLNADMTRRSLVVELFSDLDAADREITDHLDEQRLHEWRPEILGALYSLVRAWAGDGKPEPKQVNPNFVVWSRNIGGIVEHAGYTSVTEASTLQLLTDTNDTDIGALAKLMFDGRKTEAMTFTEVVTLMRTGKLFQGIIGEGDQLTRQSNTALGRMLSMQDGRILDEGLRFVIIGKGHARRYAVQQVEAKAA